MGYAGTVGELAESAPSWRHYRQEFLRTMAFGEWETYDHPVACEHIQFFQHMLAIRALWTCSKHIFALGSTAVVVLAVKIGVSHTASRIPNVGKVTDGCSNLTLKLPLCRPACAACKCGEPCGGLWEDVPQRSEAATDEDGQDGAPPSHAPPPGPCRQRCSRRRLRKVSTVILCTFVLSEVLGAYL